MGGGYLVKVGRRVNETGLYGVVAPQGYLLGNSRLNNEATHDRSGQLL